MTVPAYVNTGTASVSAGSTSRAPGRPASLVNGNLLVAVLMRVTTAETVSISGTGWTIYNPTPGTTDQNKVFATCIVSGSETDPTFSWSTSTACHAIIHQFTGNRNVNPPFGAYNTNLGSGTTHTCGHITTTHADTLGMYLHWQGANAAAGTPAGWTERSDSASGTSGESLTMGTVDMAVAGATPDVSLTGNNVTYRISIVEILGPNVAPVITSNGGGATAAINSAENQTAVTTVTATDTDTSDTLTYSISGGNDAALFTIGSSSGILTWLAAPNFENKADANADGVYEVTVQVSDGNGGTDTQAISVTVTNVNEAPVITSNGGGATASISVAENTTAVTTVTATDVDAGATLTFSKSGTDAAKFTIGSSSGVLTFTTAPDFENPTDSDANNVYLVTVTVSDGSLTDSQDLTVTVTDVFENTGNGGATKGGPMPALSIGIGV